VQQHNAMELTRRFVFRGNASAFGGRIVRPDDVVLEMPGASSLGVAGGRSVARIPRTQFKNFVSFEAASTLAEGLFDDRKAAIELSNHRMREDALKTSTRVRAEIRKLVVGSRKRFKVDRAVVEARSRSPRGSGEPSIVIEEAVLENVTIDEAKLKITFERGVFERHDTHAKLLTACDEPDFVKKYGQHFFLTTSFEGRPAPPTGRLVPGCETIYATLVKKIEWAGASNPHASIEGHTVAIKDFGRVFFGELLITSMSRRVTLMRFELGSDEGGSAGGPDVDINGGWS
jgi:hypothetical protein